MAARYEFLITGDHDAGIATVMDALASAGYVFEQAQGGGTKISRGNLTKTTLLGALAGKDFHVSFLLGFTPDPSGYLAARLDRDIGMGALKGGALGASKTGKAFDETVQQVRGALEKARLLHASGELAR